MDSKTSSRKSTTRRVPASLCPERLGFLSTLALGLLSLGGLVVLLGGTLAMVLETRRIEAQTDMAAVRTEHQVLEQELASLNQRLTGLWDVLLETRVVVGDAKLSPSRLGSAWPTNGAGEAEATSFEGDDQLSETLRQAREVSDCFETILAQMERNAAAWRGLPSIQPVTTAALSSGFGLRTDPFTGRLGWHEGLDFAVPYGTQVRATAGGLVLRAGWFGNYGQLVEIDHGNGMVTRYAHLSRLLVKPGDHLQRQDLVGEVGTTGRSNAPHLHYEVHLYGRAVNPEPYILTEFASSSVGVSGDLVAAAPHRD